MFDAMFNIRKPSREAANRDVDVFCEAQTLPPIATVLRQDIQLDNFNPAVPNECRGLPVSAFRFPECPKNPKVGRSSFTPPPNL